MATPGADAGMPTMGDMPAGGGGLFGGMMADPQRRAALGQLGQGLLGQALQPAQQPQFAPMQMPAPHPMMQQMGPMQHPLAQLYGSMRGMQPRMRGWG